MFWNVLYRNPVLCTNFIWHIVSVLEACAWDSLQLDWEICTFTLHISRVDFCSYSDSSWCIQSCIIEGTTTLPYWPCLPYVISYSDSSWCIQSCIIEGTTTLPYWPCLPYVISSVVRYIINFAFHNCTGHSFK
jgi:hypothetical protein